MSKLLEAVAEYSRNHPHIGQHLRPCLYGYTGTGKTSRADAYTGERNLSMVRLLLGTMLPEDILGLPRVVNGVTRWTMPEWAQGLMEKPGVLFLDELDKARTECLASVLTLLAELRIHEYRLHPETVIICAAQPTDMWAEDETGRALLARIVPLPVVADWNYVGGKHNLDLNGLPTPPQPKIPRLLNPAPRQVDWWLGFASHNPPEVSKAVAKLLFSEEVADHLISAKEKGTTVTVEDISYLMEHDVEKAEKTLNKMSLPELVTMAGPMLQHLPPSIWRVFTAKVWIEGVEEDAAAFLKNGYDYLVEQAKKTPDNSVEVGRGCTEEEFSKEFEICTQEIAKAWIARAEKPKKGKK